MADNAAKSEGDWSIGRLLAWTKAHFESRGVDEPRLSAELLLAKALDCRKIDLYARFEQCPTESQRATLRELVKAAGEHRPIAQLIGHKEFHSLDFVVTSDVLIPRPETELIVEQAMVWIEGHAFERCDLLDVGTGSGCIAVTLAKRRPKVFAVATDLSEAALAVAAQNAAKHGVQDRVQFVCADLLAIPREHLPAGGFDVITSNPPYVGLRERESLPRNVREYEPAAALFAGDDGLDIFRRLPVEVQRTLRPGGLLLLEIGLGQADAVTELMTRGGLTPCGRHKDLRGIVRCLAFTLPA